MNCKTSFMLSISILLVICGVAYLVVTNIDPRGSCDETKSFRCPDNGRCFPMEKMCDKVRNCMDGYDESERNCVHYTAYHQVMNRIFNLDDWSNDTELVDGFRCMHSRCWCSNKNGRVDCDGREMKKTFASIPWIEIDPRTQQLIFIHGALNTTNITSPGGKYFNYDLLLRVHISHNDNLVSIGKHGLCPLTMSSSSRIGGIIGISNNRRLAFIDSDWFCDDCNANVLLLHNNQLTLRNFTFKYLKNLSLLKLSHNNLETISEDIFAELNLLGILMLDHNQINFVHENAFKENRYLTFLDLSHNNLHQLSPLTFSFKYNLLILNLTDNPIRRTSKYIFRHLTELGMLDVSSFDETNFDFSFVKYTPFLGAVYVKRFSYCKFFTNETRCIPKSAGVSSSLYLLNGHTRYSVWVIGVLTILGNLLVLKLRSGVQRQTTNLDSSALTCNIALNSLAFADLLMGIYLIALGIKDTEYAGIFRSNFAEWSSSSLCSSIGAVSLISSEVSLFTLNLVSVERYLSVRSSNTQTSNALTKFQAYGTVVIIWIIGAVIAVVPVYHWGTQYYGSSTLCFPLHLDHAYDIGWKYTAFVIVGLNSLCTLGMAIPYALLFWEIQKARRQAINSLTHDSENAKLAVRIFLLVLTDALCWIPIIIMKISVLCGYQLSDELIYFAVLYLLPLNSAMNPILYTLSVRTLRVDAKAWIQDNLACLSFGKAAPASQGNSIELQTRFSKSAPETSNGMRDENSKTSVTAKSTELDTTKTKKSRD